MKEEYNDFIRMILCACGLKFYSWKEFEEHAREEIADLEF